MKKIFTFFSFPALAGENYRLNFDARSCVTSITLHNFGNSYKIILSNRIIYKMAQKSWSYTMNNPTEEQLTSLKALTVSTHRICREIGDKCGTVHLQGAVCFKRAYRFKQLTKLFPTAHWSPSITIDPENYCIKGEILYDVNNRRQGKRNDLHSVASAITAGNTVRQVATEFPEVYIRYSTGIHNLYRVLQPRTEEFVKMQVIVIIGKPGTGKSRMVRKLAPQVYNVMEPLNGAIWWDGYTGQDEILFDDFYGWIKYHYMLQLLDGYPMLLPVKGSTVYKNWSKVYLTSNKDVDEWYSNLSDITALRRRITQIIQI